MTQNRPIPPTDLCQELQDLLPAYVIGATTEAEANLVRELLPQCPEVAAELHIYAGISAGLMEQVNPIEPPPDLRNRLLQEALASESSSEPTLLRPKFDARFWWVAAALLIGLVGTNLLWVSLISDVRNELEAITIHNNQLTDLLSNPQIHQFPLLNTDEEDQTALAKLLWNAENNQATLVTNQLPQLQQSETYQIWLIETDTPISAGLFTVDERNQSFVEIKLASSLDRYAAIAISIEPAAGSDAPTTTPIAVGEIGI